MPPGPVATPASPAGLLLPPAAPLLPPGPVPPAVPPAPAGLLLLLVLEDGRVLAVKMAVEARWRRARAGGVQPSR